MELQCITFAELITLTELCSIILVELDNISGIMLHWWRWNPFTLTELSYFSRITLH